MYLILEEWKVNNNSAVVVKHRSFFRGHGILVASKLQLFLWQTLRFKVENHLKSQFVPRYFGSLLLSGGLQSYQSPSGFSIFSLEAKRTHQSPIKNHQQAFRILPWIASKTLPNHSLTLSAGRDLSQSLHSTTSPQPAHHFTAAHSDCWQLTLQAN